MPWHLTACSGSFYRLCRSYFVAYWTMLSPAQSVQRQISARMVRILKQVTVNWHVVLLRDFTVWTKGCHEKTAWNRALLTAFFILADYLDSSLKFMMVIFACWYAPFGCVWLVCCAAESGLPAGNYELPYINEITYYLDTIRRNIFCLKADWLVARVSNGIGITCNYFK